MFKKSTFICMLLMSCIANADIYKCVVDGNTIFSQSPCAVDAEKIKVKVHQPSEADKALQKKTTHFYQSQERNQEINALKAKNASLLADIDKYSELMDIEIEILGLKKGLARNNLAGATYRESLSQEMIAVSDKYKVKIDLAKDEINRNKAKIDQLELLNNQVPR